MCDQAQSDSKAHSNRNHDTLFLSVVIGDLVLAELRCEEMVFDNEANTCGCDSTYPKADLRE
jgi:hypothetical protein